jgi:hypothetical protein
VIQRASLTIWIAKIRLQGHCQNMRDGEIG